MELILCWPASLDETASRQKKKPTFAGINCAGRDGRQHRDEPWAPCIRQLFLGSVNLIAFAKIYEELVLSSDCTTVFTRVDAKNNATFLLKPFVLSRISTVSYTHSTSAIYTPTGHVCFFQEAPINKKLHRRFLTPACTCDTPLMIFGEERRSREECSTS